MKRIGRMIIKTTCFILLLSAAWLSVQNLVSYKWDIRERLYDRYRHFEAEPEGSVDILFSGSSPVNGGINPVIVYNEIGATGYNFGGTHKTAFCSYYELKYAFKHHVPDLLVLDLADIHIRKAPTDDSGWETAYRKYIENIPDPLIRLEMTLAYQKEFKENQVLNHLFPLLRYHERWKELTKDDYKPNPFHYEGYEDFVKGTYMNPHTVNLNGANAFSDEEVVPASDLSLRYYDKILDMCKKHGVEVMIVVVPKLKMHPSQMADAVEYAQKNNLNVLYYPNKEAFNAIGISEADSFYNVGHLNVRGQVPYSRAVAAAIKEWYDLEDHRGDPAYAAWDEAYDQYVDKYRGQTQRDGKDLLQNESDSN